MGTGKSLRFCILGKVGPEGQAVLAFSRILDHDTGGRFMIRISWLLVACLAAAMVILDGPDQPDIRSELN
jgi:hypothetical protein